MIEGGNIRSNLTDSGDTRHVPGLRWSEITATSPSLGDARADRN